MPGKKSVHALPRHMTAYTRNGRTAYKYQRRVPVELQNLIGRRTWDLSLGADLTRATSRCHAYAAEHDQLLARLSTTEGQQDYADKLNSQTAATWARVFMNTPTDDAHFGFDGSDVVISARPDSAKGVALHGSRPDQQLWRNTEATIARAEQMPSKQARDHLALFAAYAFGDRSYIERLPASDPLGNTLADIMTPTRPSDVAGIAVFDAFKSALDARLTVLIGQSTESDAYRLSTLREKYFDLNNCSPATRRGYTTKTKRLIDHLGDLPIDQYTAEMLRSHRDYLMEEMSPVSVAQYFAPIKAIMRWALQEDLVPGFDALPTEKVKMPRRDQTLEETRWQRFDDVEIGRVWRLVREGWGEDSRFSAERRAAHLMVFRVLLYTAMRPVEVFRLRPEDVTPNLIRIRKTKTRIPRDLPLSRHIADFYAFMQQDGLNCCGRPERAAETLSESFTKIIRAGGFKNDRHVLYSTKDTLVDRLQRAQCSEDVIRGMTGHVSGQGHLRNYKTRLNDTPEGIEILRKAIDAVEYW